MIKATEVERNEFGFWTHPEVPDWGESITVKQFQAWQEENRLEVNFVWLEHDAQQELVDDWFGEGLDDCSEWTPTPPSESAFLLSIHETEDGPVAWFAVPVVEEAKHA